MNDRLAGAISVRHKTAAGDEITAGFDATQEERRLERKRPGAVDLLWPDLIVVGGGVSKKADKFLPLLHVRAPIVAAQLQNSAGIIGAAWLACNGPSPAIPATA